MNKNMQENEETRSLVLLGKKNTAFWVGVWNMDPDSDLAPGILLS